MVALLFRWGRFGSESTFLVEIDVCRHRSRSLYCRKLLSDSNWNDVRCPLFEILSTRAFLSVQKHLNEDDPRLLRGESPRAKPTYQWYTSVYPMQISRPPCQGSGTCFCLLRVRSDTTELSNGAASDSRIKPDQMWPRRGKHSMQMIKQSLRVDLSDYETGDRPIWVPRSRNSCVRSLETDEHTIQRNPRSRGKGDGMWWVSKHKEAPLTWYMILTMHFRATAMSFQPSIWVARVVGKFSGHWLHCRSRWHGRRSNR